MQPNTKRRRLISGIAVGSLLQGCGGGGSAGTNTAGSGSSPVVTMPDVPGGPVVPTAQDGPDMQAAPVSALPRPSLNSLGNQVLYIAHRGAAALYPEETYTAYDGCVRDGQLCIEGDVHALSDGTLVMMHDDTVDRTTGESSSVASYTRSTWNALRIDADTWHGSHFGNRLAAPQFKAWVNRYKATSLLIPEDKDQRSMSSMLAVLASENVPKDQVLIQCFNLEPLRQAVAAGYNTCVLVTNGGPTAALADGVSWSGLSVAMSDADIRAWIASGIKVLVWTVNRRSERDARLALGVKGFFSDDPVYLSGNAPFYTTDRFDGATWLPGMLPNSGELSSAARGRFMDGGYWGYETADAGYQGCLQGYLCPIKGQHRPVDYMIELNIRFGSAAASDASRWASLFIGTDDGRFIDSDEATAGYHFLFRKNGAVEIFKKVPGKSATQLAVQNGPAFADGDEARFRIRVEAASMRVNRLAADGTESYGATANDTAYRGAYVTLGHNGLACAFRRIVVA